MLYTFLMGSKRQLQLSCQSLKLCQNNYYQVQDYDIIIIIYRILFLKCDNSE